MRIPQDTEPGNVEPGNVEGEMVKPLQSRHGCGWSTVHVASGEKWGLEGRVYIKRQSGYFTRVYWRLFRKTPRLVCEHRALNFFCSHGIPVPEIVSFSETPTLTELIIREVPDARPLNEFLADARSGDVPGVDVDAVIDELAALIASVHRLKWVHGALGNDHILVQNDGRVVLIDLEKTHWDPLRVRRDLARFWRRTDCLTDVQADRFSAAYRQYLKG